MAPTIPPDAGTIDFGELTPAQQEAALSSPLGAIQVRETGQVYKVTGIPIPDVEAPPAAPPPPDPELGQKAAFVQEVAKQGQAVVDRARGVYQDPLHLGELVKSGITGYQDIALQRQQQALAPAVAKGAKPVAGKAKPLNPQELAELRALEQQFSGQPGAPTDLGPPQPLTMRLGRYERTSPDLSPAAAKKAQGDIRRHRLQLAGALGGKNAALSAEAKVQSDLAAQFEPLVNQYAERAPQLLQRYDQLQQSLDQSRQRIEQMRIDPQQLLRSMPTTNKVLWGFGIMLGAANGNRLPMDLLERAIDRDIAGQRSNIQKAIQSHNLTQAQANALWNQYTHFEQQRRLAMLDLAKFKLGAAAVASKKADAFIDYLGATRDLDKASLDIAKAATPKVRSGSTTVINPLAVAQQKARMAASAAASAPPKINRVIDKEVRNEVVDLDTGVQKIDKIIALATQGGKHPLFWDGMPNSVATRIAQELRELALSKRRALGDSGPVVVSDFKNYGLPGTAGKLRRYMEKRNLFVLLQDARQDMQRRKFNVLRTKLGPMSNILGRAVQEASQPMMPQTAAPAGGRAQ